MGTTSAPHTRVKQPRPGHPRSTGPVRNRARQKTLTTIPHRFAWSSALLDPEVTVRILRLGPAQRPVRAAHHQ